MEMVQEMPHDAIGARSMQRAAARDKRAMVASLCDAFADDPGLNWIWPEESERLARLPHFFRAIVGGTMANGIALCSARHEAVSLWRQPGHIHPGGWEIMRGLPDMARAFRSGRDRSQRMSEALKAHQPRDFPWWYLQFIGVRSGAQGMGLGGAAVRAGLDRAARAGMPVYVEVMNPDNVGYYHHVGFRTIGEFDIPDSGPHVWSMLWRGDAPASTVADRRNGRA